MQSMKSAFLTAVFAVGAVAAPGLDAQTMESTDAEDLQDLTLSLKAGASLPSGDLADYTDAGQALGADLEWMMSNRLDLTLGTSLDVLDNAEALGTPEMRLWHVDLGADFEVTPQTSPLNVEVQGGVGATTMDTEDFLATTQVVGDEAEADFTETYVSVNGGLEVSYDLSRSVDVALGGSSHVVFADELETRVLADESPVLDPFGTAVTFPIIAKVEITLAN